MNNKLSKGISMMMPPSDSDKKRLSLPVIKNIAGGRGSPRSPGIGRKVQGGKKKSQSPRRNLYEFEETFIGSPSKFDKWKSIGNGGGGSQGRLYEESSRYHNKSEMR